MNKNICFEEFSIIPLNDHLNEIIMIIILVTYKVFQLTFITLIVILRNNISIADFNDLLIVLIHIS